VFPSCPNGRGDIVEARRAPPQRLKHIETKSPRAAACNSAAGERRRADSSAFAMRCHARTGILSPVASMDAGSRVHRRRDETPPRARFASSDAKQNGQRVTARFVIRPLPPAIG